MRNAVETIGENRQRVAEVEASRDSFPPVANKQAPLSFEQQQIWLHAQLVPETAIYNEPVTICRYRELDLPALEHAFTEVVQRHEAWRTTFAEADGEPIQTIHPPAPVQLPFVDLSQIPVEERETEAQRLALEDSLRPFNLSEGPLFRCLVVRFSENEHRVFLTLHHIIFDGYSIYRVLLPELTALYEAFSQGQNSPLAELPAQYADYAIWEREQLSRSDRLAVQLAYWKKQLDGLPLLQLPCDRSRPQIQSFHSAIEALAFSKDVSDAIKRIVRQEGCTLFMGLLAAFAVLLHRYSNSEDIPIGTVSSTRKRAEVEGLLGYFLNPVVLRTDLSGDPSFRQLLRRVRQVTLDALSNDDAPFLHVVQELHPSRSLSFNPLFQVLLTLEPPALELESGWSVGLTQSEVDTGTAKFDLALELDDRPSGLVGRFKYSTDLFDAETAARMADHLATLLEGIAASPDAAISKLPMLTAQERQQICEKWNDTAATPAKYCSIPEWFSNQAEQTPEAVSVIDGEREVSYRELDQKSNQLAAYLKKQGVFAETPVGIYLEPSAELIVSILGVLKAGGACVPLDPSYPAQRLTYVMEETGLKILVTQAHLRSLLPGKVRTVCVDSDWPVISEEATQPADTKFAAGDLAYVIFTSGSTGKPKGVEITHGNLVHSTQARPLFYGPDAGRFLLLSSFAFDSSLAGIFGTLCQGGALAVTPGSLQANLSRVTELIARYRISHILCIPSLYGLLLDQATQGQLSSLRVVIVAGEACPAELVNRHYALLPEAALFNEYGPTEATVWSTVYRCQKEITKELVPIGRPIPNTRAYVMDSYLNPVPVGVPGELYIGGLGVVRGYLNRPEETSARFIPDPFCDGARLYKTGDRVRYLPDGNLELLGRLDRQVKIRGFRIELDEIEAVICQYPEVQQAAVVVRKEKTGESQVLAYIVAEADKIDIATLGSFVSHRLPEAMVPSAFVVLENLPLTPSGKVDRNALPALVEFGPAKPLSKTTSALEQKLAEIWKTVLGKQQLGVEDNFFDLGGHSLLVAKLLLRIEQQFGKRLTIANVFQAPTIRQLASMLDGAESSRHSEALVPIQPKGSKPPLFWVRGGPLYLPLAGRLGLDQPLLGLELPAADAAKLPVPCTFEDIAAAFVVQLRKVQPEGPYYLAGLCVNGVMAYEMARQLVAQGQAVALLGLFDAQNPAYYNDFSLESRSRLMFRKVEHHIVSLKRVKRQELRGYIRDRLMGIPRRLSVLRWRTHRSLGLAVDEKHLSDLDSIVHPASFVYMPKPFRGNVVFFQSTDWPVGRYWDFHASWNGVISGDMEVYRIAGGHESMFHVENVDALADKLSGALATAQTGSSAVASPGHTNVAGTQSASPVSAKTPTIRVACFDDYEGIAKLESDYLGGTKPRGEWKHLWLNNPVYRENSEWPIGWILENARGRIVGHIGNVPLSYEFGGRRLLAAASRAVVVDSRYRAHSLALLNHFFKQPNVDLLLETTVNADATKAQQIFHAQQVPAGEWNRSIFWITNHRGFAESVLAVKGLPFGEPMAYPLSWGLQVKDVITHRAIDARQNGIEIGSCTAFDDRFEVFWQELKRKRGNVLTATRSREVLEWHFGKALESNRAWVLTMQDGSNLVAYAIFSRQDNPAIGLKRMRLADFQTLSGNDKLLGSFVFRALKLCRSHKIHVLDIVGLDAKRNRVLEELRPYRRELDSWLYYYKAVDTHLARELRNPEAWSPSCFDGDSTL